MVTKSTKKKIKNLFFFFETNSIKSMRKSKGQVPLNVCTLIVISSHSPSLPSDSRYTNLVSSFLSSETKGFYFPIKISTVHSIIFLSFFFIFFLNCTKKKKKKRERKHKSERNKWEMHSPQGTQPPF